MSVRKWMTPKQSLTGSPTPRQRHLILVQCLLLFFLLSFIIGSATSFSTISKHTLSSRNQKPSAKITGGVYGPDLLLSLTEMADIFTKHNTLRKVVSVTEFNSSSSSLEALKTGIVEFAIVPPPSQNESYVNDGDIQLLPFSAQAICIIYNIQSSVDLVLDGNVLTGIFNGSISMWNDPRIRQLNPSLPLAPKEIQVLVRGDSTITNKILSRGLSIFDPNWATNYGVFRQWPRERRYGGWGSRYITTNSDLEMTDKVEMTPYSIGYNTFGSCTKYSTHIASIQTDKNTKISPSKESIQLLMATRGVPTSANLSIIDLMSSAQNNSKAYPLAEYVYVGYLHHNMTNCNDALAVYLYLRHMIRSDIIPGLRIDSGLTSLNPTMKEWSSSVLNQFTCHGVILTTGKDIFSIIVASVFLACVMLMFILVIFLCTCLLCTHKQVNLTRKIHEANPGPDGFVVIVHVEICDIIYLIDSFPDVAKESIPILKELIEKLIIDFEGYRAQKGRVQKVIFKSIVSAIEFCNELHVYLMQVPWPSSLLNISEFSEQVNPDSGDLVYRGIKVKATIHVGEPRTEMNTTTHLTTYTGEVADFLTFSHQYSIPGTTLLTADAYQHVRTYGDVDRSAQLLLDGCKIVRLDSKILPTQLEPYPFDSYSILPNELAKRILGAMSNTVPYLADQPSELENLEDIDHVEA